MTPSPHTPSVSEDLDAQITTRAYEMYEQRLRHGALDDWLQAEQEILRHKKTGNPDMSHRGGYAGQEQARSIIPQPTYDEIKDRIIAKQKRETAEALIS